MNAVLQEIGRQKALAIAEVEARLAAVVVTSLDYRPAPGPADWQEFANWCAGQGVPHCPARPATVAGYVLTRSYLGFDEMMAQLDAIASLHDVMNSNPVSTGIVGAAIAKVFPKATEPPKSWRGDEQASFRLLPTWAQAAIARREMQRDRALTVKFQKIAEERKKDVKAEQDTKDAA